MCLIHLYFVIWDILFKSFAFYLFVFISFFKWNSMFWLMSFEQIESIKFVNILSENMNFESFKDKKW